MRVLAALAIAALVVAALLLAAAWRDGPADFRCKCACDREGRPISLDEASARQQSYEDRDGLLARSFVAACAGGATSLVGVVAAAIRRAPARWLLTFGGSLATAALFVVAAFFSLPPLVPCFGE